MIFNGFNKTDLINYPSNIAATLFLRGCNFRCPYCHNASLVDPKRFSEESYSEEEVFDYLNQRKSFLDGVVVTGGEPTLYNELPEFMKKVHDIGLKTKLDTNGTNPAMVEKLVSEHLIDYLAMDIKAPFGKYNIFVGNAFVDVEGLIRQTMEILRNGDVPYEFRTTCPKNILTLEDFDEIASMLHDNEVWYLQEFNPNIVLDESFGGALSYTGEELKAIAAKYKMARVRY